MVLQQAPITINASQTDAAAPRRASVKRCVANGVSAPLRRIYPQPLSFSPFQTRRTRVDICLRSRRLLHVISRTGLTTRRKLALYKKGHETRGLPRKAATSRYHDILFAAVQLDISALKGLHSMMINYGKM